MKAGNFRKLYINLPQEPVINDRHWFVAGLLLAFLFLLFVVYAYMKHK